MIIFSIFDQFINNNYLSIIINYQFSFESITLISTMTSSFNSLNIFQNRSILTKILSHIELKVCISILFLFLMIYLLIKFLNINSENNFNILNILFLINTILVFYLYSTIWKEIELGSSYRYLFSFITIVFVDLQLSLDKLYKNLEKL